MITDNFCESLIWLNGFLSFRFLYICCMVSSLSVPSTTRPLIANQSLVCTTFREVRQRSLLDTPKRSNAWQWILPHHGPPLVDGLCTRRHLVHVQISQRRRSTPYTLIYDQRRYARLRLSMLGTRKRLRKRTEPEQPRLCWHYLLWLDNEQNFCPKWCALDHVGKHCSRMSFWKHLKRRLEGNSGSHSYKKNLNLDIF